MKIISNNTEDDGGGDAEARGRRQRVRRGVVVEDQA